MGERRVRWFGCGSASAVAIALDLKANPGGEIFYCETGSEHPDNQRFMADCERWWDRKVTRLRAEQYPDTWAVWEKRRYLSNGHGAPCTTALKIEPRIAAQLPDDIHIFGYTTDKRDAARAISLREHFFELTIETPLITAGLDKAACHAIVKGAGIELPPMYALGFSNNNCIPCVKASSPNYWAAIRLHFPAEFERMVKLSRELGARLTRINAIRIFIDEIPADWPTLNPIAPACDFLCHLAEKELAA